MQSISYHSRLEMYPQFPLWFGASISRKKQKVQMLPNTECHQYYYCPGSKYGRPPVSSTGSFRFYLFQGVTVVHGFTVRALDPKVEKELIL